MNIHALRNDIRTVDHPVYGRIEVDPDLGTINVPEDLAAELLGIRVNGVPLWESDVDYDRRRAVAELERKRDPAQHALLLEKLISLQAAQAGVDLNAPITAPPVPGVPVVKAPASDPDAEAVKVAAAIEAKDYDSLGRNDLSKLAKSRGLNGGGNVAELIARLRDQDNGRK